MILNRLPTEKWLFSFYVRLLVYSEVFKIKAVLEFEHISLTVISYVTTTKSPQLLPAPKNSDQSTVMNIFIEVQYS